MVHHMHLPKLLPPHAARHHPSDSAKFSASPPCGRCFWARRCSESDVQGEEMNDLNRMCSINRFMEKRYKHIDNV